MKEYYFAVIKFPVLVSTVLIILVGLFFLLALGSNSRTGISGNETIIYTLVFISLVFLVSNWILVLMSTHSVIKPPFVQRFSHWMLTQIYYPMAKALNFITFQKTHTLQESFLNFNNEIVMSNYMRLENPKMLVLLPHCLQGSECKIRITNDINDCADCGSCDICTVKNALSSQPVKVAVASGGSLARKLIADNRPDLIIAVACHRDLTEGVRDAWQFPVYSILNERPKGPCFETTVSLKAIEFAINRFK